MLLQQSYTERLRQYLARRRFEERENIDIDVSYNAVELVMQSDWQGWILTTGTFSIDGCTALPFTHYGYHVGSQPYVFSLPWWD